MDQSAGIWSHCLDIAALSDIGVRRANNQDSYTVALAGSEEDFRQRGHLFMVADGMGGHAAGELASKMATDIVPLDYRKLLDQTPAEALLSAVLDANHQIHVRGQASPEFRGMGTTATILALLPSGALLAHVGDSRCYRVRGDRIEQLTFDHSFVWEMQAAGQMPEGGIPGFISKSSITRSLGPHPTEQVDLEGPHAVQAGDTFVLCSDGLSNQVKDDEIGLVLNCLPPAEAVHALIELACLRGGPDNITAVVVRVLGPQVPEAADAAPARRSRKSNARPVAPWLWTLLGVASLATLGLAALEQWLPFLCWLHGRRGGVGRGLGEAIWRPEQARIRRSPLRPRPLRRRRLHAQEGTSCGVCRHCPAASRSGERRTMGSRLSTSWTGISPRPSRPPEPATWRRPPPAISAALSP